MVLLIPAIIALAHIDADLIVLILTSILATIFELIIKR